jgi:hypothetical protein
LFLAHFDTINTKKVIFLRLDILCYNKSKYFKGVKRMQSFTIEVNDNIADKILWLLDSFKNDVKVIPNNSNNKLDTITKSLNSALDEVEKSKQSNTPRQNAWDLLDEL